MSAKIKNLIKWSNENGGPLGILGLLITALTLVFGNFYVGVVLLTVLIFSGIWYFFYDHLKKQNKYIIGTVLIVSIVIALYIGVQKLFFSGPKIFNLTKGFEVIFEDEFIGGNLSNNAGYPWWNKDNQVTNSEDKELTLKSSAQLHQVYPIFQNLKNLNKDHILLTKFYLPDGARISTQFMNTQGIDSDQYLGYHFQECMLSSYKGVYNGENYSKGYGEYIYERRPVAGGSFNKIEVTPGTYYMLVFVSSSKFSCYIQKEGERGLFHGIQ